MRTVGPEALIVGVPNTITDPAQQGGNPSAACQIQNSSGYQLTVLAGGDELSIQPFTAQTVEISGQPMQVTPITSSGSGAANVTFVFLLTVAPGEGVQLPDGTWVETPPQQDGPLTAAAISAAISGLVVTGTTQDLLASGTLTLVNSGTLEIATITVTGLTKSYSSLLLAWNPAGGATLVCAQAQVSTSPAAFSAGFGPQPGTIPMQGIIPFANMMGDTLVLTVYSFAAAGQTATYRLYGLTSCPIPVRSDGRAYPLGALSVFENSTAVVPSVLGALSNARYLIKSANGWINAQAAGFAANWSYVSNTNGQQFGSLGAAPGAAGAGWEVDESGILCDINTAVGWNGGGAATVRSTLTYDIVPA